MLGEAIQITGQDVFNWGVPAVLAAFGLSMRSLFFDMLRRVRFLMGFGTALAKVAKDLRPLLRRLESDPHLSPVALEVIRQIKPLIESTAELVDELLSIPEGRSAKMDESILKKLEDFLREQEQHKGPPK